ncbi:NtaA/DmoA family FMN-dependent monooxygenase [Pseudonocardia kujensis]|uniref:NtaA/DmoA family FMN-dependent monooxygenase n=1 Tax=Pseudonocardia kujensis TaxID=1128675 RepID=UPI001E5F21C4|nr:NtaA/DmoA family FMN-dependent monooxygenase [Pseudonocardia kujensis]MCE0764552.1 NtaA/DmoA family FMN-dependent monooxygenase [Pseudonocardia kujensis]
MSDPKFHLGWFHSSGFSPAGWNAEWAGHVARDWADPGYYVDMVRSLERARFDCLVMEDSSFVPEDYGSSPDYYLRNAFRAPKNDPVPLMAILGQHTSRLGLLPTMSTSFYPPFLAARLIATMDHLNGGRAGANLVTSTSDTAAQNYGLDTHFLHDERYRMAEEFVKLVDELWASWDADAIVNDREAGMFADPTKVRRVDFAGKYFRSRGPLNTPRPPQGRPVISQAGGSPQGRDFAARTADIMLGSAGSLEDMKALRDDMRSRVAAAGRPSDALKVLFVIGVKIVETEAGATELRARAADLSDERIVAMLAGMSSITGIDFAQFDLDEPLGELTTNGQQGTLAQFLRGKDGRTLREIVKGYTRTEDFIGTPGQVARRLAEINEECRGDGFLISTDNGALRKHLFDVTEGLAPELQRLGLTRTDYASERFRDNLFAF